MSETEDLREWVADLFERRRREEVAVLADPKALDERRGSL